MFYVFEMFLSSFSCVQCWYRVYISKILDYCLFFFLIFFFKQTSAASACMLSQTAHEWRSVGFQAVSLGSPSALGHTSLLPHHPKTAREEECEQTGTCQLLLSQIPFYTMLGRSGFSGSRCLLMDSRQRAAHLHARGLGLTAPPVPAQFPLVSPSPSSSACPSLPSFFSAFTGEKKKDRGKRNQIKRETERSTSNSLDRHFLCEIKGQILLSSH